jgi:SAM-dependent methyltransferase
MVIDAHLKRDRAQAFDGVAQDYERFRPGYPEALREYLEEHAALKSGARILEIGVGPGQATRLFLGRGYRIVGIEPGDRLRTVAWETLDQPADLTLEAGTFENWDDEKRSFDLIYSGSAFHWVNPEIGFPKAARLLRPGGNLALFWNMFPDPSDPVWEELTQIYQRLAPEIAASRCGRKFTEKVEERRQQILDTRLFSDLSVGHFPWSIVYSATDYLKLIMTYSDHIVLPVEQRKILLKELEAVIHRHGGVITRPWDTVLFLARVSSS